MWGGGELSINHMENYSIYSRNKLLLCTTGYLTADQSHKQRDAREISTTLKCILHIMITEQSASRQVN